MKQEEPNGGPERIPLAQRRLKASDGLARGLAGHLDRGLAGKVERGLAGPYSRGLAGKVSGIGQVSDALSKLMPGESSAVKDLSAIDGYKLPPVPEVADPGIPASAIQALDEMAERRRADMDARTAREEAMVEALTGVLRALEEQAQDQHRAAAVNRTVAVYTFLAVVAGVLATAWAISGSWAWTLGCGLASVLTAVLAAVLLGAVRWRPRGKPAG